MAVCTDGANRGDRRAEIWPCTMFARTDFSTKYSSYRTDYNDTAVSRVYGMLSSHAQGTEVWDRVIRCVCDYLYVCLCVSAL